MRRNTVPVGPGCGICGAVIGFIGFILSLFLLGWNESAAVRDYRAISSCSRAVVTVPCGELPPGADIIVHSACPLGGATPLSDPALGVNITALRLVRSVERLQYVRTATRSTCRNNSAGDKVCTDVYDYGLQWRREPVPLGDAVYTNPVDAWPLTGMSWVAPAVTVGRLALPGSLLEKALDAGRSTVPVSQVTAPSWPPAPDAGYVRWEGAAATVGGANSTAGALVAQYGALGSFRATLAMYNATEGSILAAWDGSTLVPKDSAGRECFYFSAGRLRAQEILDNARDVVEGRTWALRFVGLILVWVCLAMVGFAATSSLAALPFVGGAASQAAGCVVCCISVPMAISLSLMVIALSWVIVRPAVGLGIILPLVLLTHAGAAYFYWVYRVKADTGAPKKVDAEQGVTVTTAPVPQPPLDHTAAPAVGAMHWVV